MHPGNGNTWEKALKLTKEKFIGKFIGKRDKNIRRGNDAKVKKK